MNENIYSYTLISRVFLYQERKLVLKQNKNKGMYAHKCKFRKNITNSPKLLKALTSSLEARLSARIFKLSEDLMAVAI